MKLNICLTLVCLILAVETYAQNCNPCFKTGTLPRICATNDDNLCTGSVSRLGAAAPSGIQSGGSCGARAPFYLFSCGTGNTGC